MVIRASLERFQGPAIGAYHRAVTGTTAPNDAMQAESSKPPASRQRAHRGEDNRPIDDDFLTGLEGCKLGRSGWVM
jgi:hypothetical protein